MQCLQCQCENTETARFCEECGARLVRAYPGCGQEEAAEMLTALLGESAGLRALTQLMLARTEGNPFFIEALVQALVQQGVLRRAPTSSPGAPAYVLTGPVPALHIPPTVQGVLAARID